MLKISKTAARHIVWVCNNANDVQDGFLPNVPDELTEVAGYIEDHLSVDFNLPGAENEIILSDEMVNKLTFVLGLLRTRE